MIFNFGKEQNRLVITIRSIGKVKAEWSKETWKKVFRDGWRGVVSMTKKIVAAIAVTVNTLGTTAAKLALMAPV